MFMVEKEGTVKMYKCEKCGFAFSEPEIVRGRIDFEYWGYSTYDYSNRYRCPECGSEDYEVAKECSDCGTISAENEMPCNTLCQECFDKYTSDFDNVYNMFNGDFSDDVKINGLVVGLLSIEEINEILYKYVKKHFGMGYCKEFNDFVSENANEIGEAIDEMEVI